jgi:hypothetical protein
MKNKVIKNTVVRDNCILMEMTDNSIAIFHSKSSIDMATANRPLTPYELFDLGVISGAELLKEEKRISDMKLKQKDIIDKNALITFTKRLVNRGHDKEALVESVLKAIKEIEDNG